MRIQRQLGRAARSGDDGSLFTHPYRNVDGFRETTAPSRFELLQLLNEDFARECQGVYAYAVYAERFRDTNPAAARACDVRGKREVAHAMALCQLVYDFGGAVTATVDDRAAVLRAAQVSRTEWSAETVRRLRERADQLRSAGQHHLASRLLVLIDHKQAASDLADILRRHPGPAGPSRDRSPSGEGV